MNWTHSTLQGREFGRLEDIEFFGGRTPPPFMRFDVVPRRAVEEKL